MQNPLPKEDFLDELWRSLEIVFWTTLASQAPTSELRTAYLKECFYAATKQ